MISKEIMNSCNDLIRFSGSHVHTVALISILKTSPLLMFILDNHYTICVPANY